MRELADGERIVAGLGQPLARALGVRMNADYRLRRFTPRAELPFAGHPTTGSAHVVLEAGIAQPRDGRLRQECGAGILEPSVEGELRVS